MNNWQINYNDWDKDSEPIRETLCTLGNGYFFSRGAAEESSADGVHYPGTYLAGGYNRLKSDIAGKVIENEDLVNFPNWLCLTFKIAGDTSWFTLEDVDIISFHQCLNIKQGVLTREIRFQDHKNRQTTLKTFRIVSLHNPHLAAIRWQLTPENWSGQVIVRTALDGAVKNAGVARYRKLNNKHLTVLSMETFEENSISLLVQTNQSRLYMAQASRCHVFENSSPKAATHTTKQENEKITQEIAFEAKQHCQVTVDKIIAIFTSRDHACSEPLLEAQQAVLRADGFDTLLKNHVEKWGRIWRRFDLKIDAEGNSELLCRLYLFHFLQICSPHITGLDVGVPARGWHGEAYRGHIFWDELFIFPLLNTHTPELTRSLLLYRYRRLPEARHAAKKAGFKGAMFPWQSGSNGREESQIIHLNPNSGRWVPDHTYLQRHVNAIIAYNIWQYFEVSNDLNFMLFYGAEMFLEIAFFLSSLTTYSIDKGRFEIKGVVGPDEFHTAYPDADRPGIDNNAYTNLMSAWVFTQIQTVLEKIGDYRKHELLQKLAISDDVLKRWEEISRKMFIPFTANGVINQFEGYDQLLDLDLERYRQKYGNIQRMDRILDAEGDSVNRYKITKQADVLMLFYLFSSEELTYLLQRLGYNFDPATIPAHIDYYTPHTTLGSSLSGIVHSWVIARRDRKNAWNPFRQALSRDVEGGLESTTHEGIHLGSLAGAVDIIQRGFTGLVIRNNVLWLNPLFPDELKKFEFKLNYRGCWLQLFFNHDHCTVFFERGAEGKITIGFRDKVYDLELGEKRIFAIKTI